MRIIAGKAKGRRLSAPDGPGTRPVTDRVKEAVFSSIGDWVEDADVADLYAGSGSFGLEALSRGARSAVFVENGFRAIEALKRNISSVALGGEVFSGKVRSSSHPTPSSSISSSSTRRGRCRPMISKPTSPSSTRPWLRKPRLSPQGGILTASPLLPKIGGLPPRNATEIQESSDTKRRLKRNDNRTVPGEL
jgi:hypothetical protein